jgi:hypothetical protein
VTRNQQRLRGAIVKKGLVLGVSDGVVAVMLLALMPAVALAQPRDPEAQRRRNQIRLMEGVFIQAVRLGAEQVSKELERFEPTGVTVMMGTPRARGFVLDGHGVFFDVEVPDMNQSVIWSVMQAQRDRQVGNALDSLRSALRSMPEGTSMQQAQMALQVVEKTVGPIPASKEAGSPVQPAPGQVGAATATVTSPDPRVLYQDAVIGNLVDAMLGYSVQMSLGPEEWLTVAARGNDAQLSPQQGLGDIVTITVKVKGTDLAIYHAEPARRGEIREKVKADAKVF